MGKVLSLSDTTRMAAGMTDGSIRKTQGLGKKYIVDSLSPISDKAGTTPWTPEEIVDLVYSHFPSLEEFRSTQNDKLFKFDKRVSSFDDKFVFQEAGSALHAGALFFHHLLNDPVMSVEKGILDCLFIKNDPSNANFDEVMWSSPSLLIQYEKSKDEPAVLLQRVTRSELLNNARTCEEGSKIPSIVCMDKMLRSHGIGLDDTIILWNICPNNDISRPTIGGWLRSTDTFNDIKNIYLRKDFDIDASDNYFVWCGRHAEENAELEQRQKAISILQNIYKIMAYSSIIHLRPEPIPRKN